MPRDMAMHEPCTRIIRLERDNEPATCWQHGDVTTRWVCVLESGGIDDAREGASAGAKEVEIVTVEVDGVGCNGNDTSYCLDDPEVELWVISISY